MKKDEFTAHQKQYIRENRLKMSIMKMGKQLDLSYTRVRNFMIENNLELSKDQVQQLRQKTLRTTNNRWYFDAYNS